MYVNIVDNTIEVILKVKKIMAKPIELGLVLEGEDAEEFWENEKKSATRQQVEMFKKARKISDSIRF
ncbi:MAG: hypothetical protein PWP14_1996 [Methanolobus sp.]|nr:hypothetical protein [Methanolobus sp.]